MHEFNLFFYSGNTGTQTIYIRFQRRIQNPVKHLGGGGRGEGRWRGRGEGRWRGRGGPFVKIINGMKPLTIFTKRFILDV